MTAPRVLVLTALLLAGCRGLATETESDRRATLPPPPVLTVLQAPADTIRRGENLALIVRLTEATGVPMGSSVVTFTFDLTVGPTFRRVTVIMAPTDSAGVARGSFPAEQSGTYTLSASKVDCVQPGWKECGAYHTSASVTVSGTIVDPGP